MAWCGRMAVGAVLCVLAGCLQPNSAWDAPESAGGTDSEGSAASPRLDLGSPVRGVAENLRSIGTHEGPLLIGAASASAGSFEVEIADGLLPQNVGAGDRLVIAGGTAAEEIHYVLDRADAQTLVVQAPIERDHDSAAFELVRAYPGIREWAAQVRGDLVADLRRETGVVYADATIEQNVVIEGATTGRCCYLRLTVEASQRHNGEAGTGVVLDPSVDGHAIEVQVDHTRIEWLEITDWTSDAAGSASFDAINVRARDVVVNGVLIHDDGSREEPNSDSNGITVEADGASATVRNSIVYNIARSGITIHGVSSALLRVHNCSLLNCVRRDNYPGSYGCVHQGGEASVIEVFNVAVDVGSGGGPAFSGSMSAESDFNLSTDSTAPGLNSHVEVNSAVFVSTEAGAEDLHSDPGSVAINSGIEIPRPGLIHDIDGHARVAPWDIGADEL